MDQSEPTALLELMRQSASPVVRDLATEFGAFRRLLLIDREMALVRARRIVERLAHTLFSERVGEVGKRDLNALLYGLKAERIIAPGLYAQLMLVREMGNIGAHSTVDGGVPGSPAEEPVSAEELLVCEHALFLALKHFTTQMHRDRAPATAPAGIEYVGAAISDEQVQQVVDLAGVAYPAGVVLPVDIIRAWRRANPEVLHVIAEPSTKRVMGYILALPLTTNAFARTLQEDFDEKWLSDDDVLPYDMPDLYYLYVSSIVVDPAHRQSGTAYRALVDGFARFMVNLAERDVFIVELSADAVTRQGERMCRSIGMRMRSRRQNGDAAFHAVMLPPSFRSVTRSGVALHRHYARKYEELKDILHLLTDDLPSSSTP